MAPGAKPSALAAEMAVAGIHPAEGGRILAGELRIQPPVVEEHETETAGLESGALAFPAIVVGARRIAEPITRKGKAATQGWQRFVPGILILVEAEVGFAAWLERLPQCRWCATQDSQAEPQQVRDPIDVRV